MTRARSQFEMCLNAFYEVEGDLNELPIEDVENWYREFSDDILRSRRGYPLVPVRATPTLEDRIGKIAQHYGFKKRVRAPAICLTHDVDYIRPTLQMNIKRFIADKKIPTRHHGKNFMKSLQTLLETDPHSTVFIANPKSGKGFLKRSKQWILDPSYSMESEEFRDLIDLLNSFSAEIGIHGSFFSLEDSLLGLEREGLEQKLGRPVRSGRQHWLNLPTKDTPERIYRAGIGIDSSLGWNGAVGFRGGMARPFPIVLDDGQVLWEVPLLLMDGPMFVDMKLRTEQVVEKAMSLLTEVHKRSGCVAINWHERSADPDYGWYLAYREIIENAKSLGFRFVTVSEAVQEWGNLVSTKDTL